MPWLAEMVGLDALVVRPDDEFSSKVPFSDRTERAIALLAKQGSDVVYVNSLAASCFVSAAKALGLVAVVHVHEKAAEIDHLLRHDLCKIETLRLADAAVLAADDLEADIAEVFGSAPSYCLNFGIAIDVEAVVRLAEAEPDPVLNAAGESFERGERLVVGMCGHASPRKGSDIFLSVASEVPECDFLWIGGWTPTEAIENTAYEDFKNLALPNLYVTGVVRNPYAHMRQLDLFFLSSREDPNPLVLAEATVLGVPILCFSGTTAVTAWLGRTAIMCYGKTNAPDAARVIRGSEPGKLRSSAFRQLVDQSQSSADFDSEKKVEQVIDLVSALRRARQESPAAQPTKAARISTRKRKLKK